MIKSITSSSQHLYAANGSGFTPYISSNPNNPAQGMLRINGSELQVFDGNTWTSVYLGSVDIGLTGNANSAIAWAIEKMEEEKKWVTLSEKNEAVKIALDNLETARQQVSITAKLARDYDTETTS